MLDKVKQGFKRFGNKIAAVVTGGAVMATTAITAFAADTAGTPAEGVSAAKNLLDTAAGSLNITNVVAIIGAGIGAVVGLFLAWWGARKLVRMLVSALKKGKVAI
mgnify:FL=1|jgi:ABC-type transport system involved in cytochrome c biogenesis permease subunit